MASGGFVFRFVRRSTYGQYCINSVAEWRLLKHRTFKHTQMEDTECLMGTMIKCKKFVFAPEDNDVVNFVYHLEFNGGCMSTGNGERKRRASRDRKKKKSQKQRKQKESNNNNNEHNDQLRIEDKSTEATMLELEESKPVEQEQEIVSDDITVKTIKVNSHSDTDDDIRGKDFIYETSNAEDQVIDETKKNETERIEVQNTEVQVESETANEENDYNAVTEKVDIAEKKGHESASSGSDTDNSLDHKTVVISVSTPEFVKGLRRMSIDSPEKLNVPSSNLCESISCDKDNKNEVMVFNDNTNSTSEVIFGQKSEDTNVRYSNHSMQKVSRKLVFDEDFLRRPRKEPMTQQEIEKEENQRFKEHQRRVCEGQRRAIEFEQLKRGMYNNSDPEKRGKLAAYFEEEARQLKENQRVADERRARIEEEERERKRMEFRELNRLNQEQINIEKQRRERKLYQEHMKEIDEAVRQQQYQKELKEERERQMYEQQMHQRQAHEHHKQMLIQQQQQKLFEEQQQQQLILEQQRQQQQILEERRQQRLLEEQQQRQIYEQQQRELQMKRFMAEQERKRVLEEQLKKEQLEQKRALDLQWAYEQQQAFEHQRKQKIFEEEQREMVAQQQRLELLELHQQHKQRYLEQQKQNQLQQQQQEEQQRNLILEQQRQQQHEQHLLQNQQQFQFTNVPSMQAQTRQTPADICNDVEMSESNSNSFASINAKSPDLSPADAEYMMKEILRQKSANPNNSDLSNADAEYMMREIMKQKAGGVYLNTRGRAASTMSTGLRRPTAGVSQVSIQDDNAMCISPKRESQQPQNIVQTDGSSPAMSNFRRPSIPTRSSDRSGKRNLRETTYSTVASSTTYNSQGQPTEPPKPQAPIDLSGFKSKPKQ